MSAPYNAANSLSPMMFKRVEKGEKEGGGTRNERWRSKSVENIYDPQTVQPPPPSGKKSKLLSRFRAATTADTTNCKGGKKAESAPNVWREVDRVKSQSPIVACIVPSLAMDFVASALLAVGANPLIPEGKKGELLAVLFTSV